MELVDHSEPTRSVVDQSSVQMMKCKLLEGDGVLEYGNSISDQS